MKSPLLYLIEALFCSGVLLAFYRLLLVRRVSFRACRRYLLAALALSVVIPALDIPLYPCSGADSGAGRFRRHGTRLFHAGRFRRLGAAFARAC